MIESARFKSLEDFARDDIFDSRDAQERIEYLEIETDPEEQLELDQWVKVREEAEGYSGDGWRDGITFIAESYFITYAQDLASDIGAIKSDAGWPTEYIDWPRAADALKMDYMSIEIGGYEFWFR